MSTHKYRKCYFRCNPFRVLHRFPNPFYYHNEERFNLWISVLDPEMQKRDVQYIYNNLKLCDRHFEPFYHTPSKKLTRNAVPTLNIVESAEKATLDANVYSDVATEEVISDYEGSNDCRETITECQKPNVIIQEVLIIPSRTKTSLQATEKKRNNEEIRPVPAVLSNMTCDNCSRTIVGFHYKCLICVKYIHCHKCEMQEMHPHHYMIRMPKSPQPKVSEKIMEDMCNKFKTSYPISSAKDNYTPGVENILRDNESGRNESTACDSDGDLSEDVKLLINREVTRVKDKLVDKTNQVKTDSKKIKRKNIFYNDTPKKRKMCIKTHTVNDETPSVVGTDRNENISDVSINNETKVDHESREKNICPDTIATVVTDPSSPGAVNMMLSDIVSQLIIEITRDGEKTTFKYVDT